MKNESSRWLAWGTGQLDFLDSVEARQECEQALEFFSGVSRPEFYLSNNQLQSEIFPQFAAWVSARKKRIPLAYLLKRASFWDDELEVEKGVFIPRPETEILIEAFLKSSGFSKTISFHSMDLGTGSGNIAVTLAKLFQNSSGVAVDLSREALNIAMRNAERLEVKDRLRFVQADGLKDFAPASFDCILSNPPYVVSQECSQLQPEVLCEPRLALDGGHDGLCFYRKIFHQLDCLKPGGSLWLEIGLGQAEAVRLLFEEKGFKKISIFKDLNGIDRMINGVGFYG